MAKCHHEKISMGDKESDYKKICMLCRAYTNDKGEWILPTSTISDGSTASYYELPPDCSELQHLISHRNMNAQIGEIFRACYRYGQASHSDCLRDAKKILFYAKAEVERLEVLNES